MSRVRKLYESVYGFERATGFMDYARNRLLARVTQVKSGQRMLDVGCNDGAVMEFFKNRGCQVSGIDISEVALARARARGLPDLRQGSVEDPFPWPEAEFDLVFWGDNVEHLFEPMAALLEIRRVLKPGGTLWVSTPNAGYWKARIYPLFKGAPMRTEGHLNPPWAWEHIRFFNQTSLDDFLKAGGLRPVAHHGVGESPVGQVGAGICSSLFSSILLTSAIKPL